MKRKVIQIFPVLVDEDQEERLYVLCDDGTMWWLTVKDEWVQIPDIPPE